MKGKLVIALAAAIAALIGCAGVEPYVQDIDTGGGPVVCRPLYAAYSGGTFNLFPGGSDTISVYVSLNPLAAASNRTPLGDQTAPPLPTRAPSGPEPILVSVTGLPAGVTILVDGEPLPDTFTVPETGILEVEVEVSADGSVEPGTYPIVVHVERTGCATIDVPLTIEVSNLETVVAR